MALWLGGPQEIKGWAGPQEIKSLTSPARVGPSNPSNSCGWTEIIGCPRESMAPGPPGAQEVIGFLVTGHQITNDWAPGHQWPQATGHRKSMTGNDLICMTTA